MLNLERETKIVEILEEKKAITVSELSEIFKVTGATIRRDLEKLERGGYLKRAFGGAVSIRSTSFELSYDRQKGQFKEEKERIGKAASKLIVDNSTIFLDSGTTVLAIAKNIESKSNLTVMTNSLESAQALTRKQGIDIILTGGELRIKTMTLLGPLAENNIKEIKVDKAFLGISAITIEKGMSTASPIEAQIKKMIINSAREVIGVADHSKFGKESFIFVAGLETLNKIIVDSKISQDYLNQLRERNIEVILV